jgi:hypothetical protein
MAIHICCKYMFQMFQLFQTYIVSVLFGCCICCNGYTRMLQVYVSNVLALSNVCCKWFIQMLYMLYWIYTYVASVCFKCLALSNICCNITYVALAIHVCCKRIFVNISSVLDICCKCYMTRRGKWTQKDVVPSGAAVPAWAREAKRARCPPQACTGTYVLQQQRTRQQQYQRIGGTGRCWMIALCGPPRQSGRYGAHVPSVDCMNLGKCVSVLFPTACSN